MRKLNGQEEEQQGFKLDIAEYLRLLWRKKLMVVLPLFLALVVAYVGARFLPPLYEANAVLRIENPRVLNREMERLVETSRQRLHDSEVRARLISDLTSSVFLDQLALSLGFERDPVVIRRAEIMQANNHPDVSLRDLVMRQLRNMLGKRIKVDVVGPSLFKFTYMDANPEACYIIADAMSKLYVDEHQKQQVLGIQEVSDFSEEQLSVYKQQLERSENELGAFQRNMGKLIVESNPVVEANISVARSLKRQLGADIAELELVVNNLERRITEHIGRVPDSNRILADRRVQNLRADLIANVEAELLSELNSAGQASGGTLARGDEIGTIQKDLLTRIGELIKDQYPDVDRDYRPLIDEYVFQAIQLTAHEQKLEQLDGYIARFQKNVNLAPQLDAELKRLQAEVSNNRTLYEQFLRAKTQTQIAGAAQDTGLSTSMAVVETATFPLEPVKPNKMKILMLAAMFGLSLGFGGLLFSEFSDTSFKSVEEVEKKMGMRVIGTVPKIESMGGSWKGENRVKKAAIWTSTAVVLAAVAVFAFYFYGKSTKENMVTFRMTNSQQTSGDRN
jgi:uncharacterized protein involved in exopolysaccharide biosynthesis